MTPYGRLPIFQSVAAAPSSDDALHISRRRQFRPRSCPPGETRFYTVRVGGDIGKFSS